MAISLQPDPRMQVLYARVALLTVPDISGKRQYEMDNRRSFFASYLESIDERVQQAALESLHGESWAQADNERDRGVRYLLAFLESGGNEIAAAHLVRIPPRILARPNRWTV